jgi:carbonic anhydrase/acetyltransferase-like protein (isoleucine patch superfamily)
VEELTIGDYTTIHHGSTIHGIKTKIGHNCWIGQYSIIDSLGGLTTIGNNVGIGAHSQLWSHMKFGDLMSGCLWNSSGKITIADEVWLVGHTIIGPITANKQSMLLTGGVMMKDMEANTIYAGNPAKNLTQLGPQYSVKSIQEKKHLFHSLLQSFKKLHPSISIEKFIIVNKFNKDLFYKGLTQFNLESQKYQPQYSLEEYKLIKFMLYDKAKFIPCTESK